MTKTSQMLLLPGQIPSTIHTADKPLCETLEYNIPAFIPIQEDDTDQATTQSDLNILNGFLAMSVGSMPYISNIESLCKLAQTASKLIEARRKVKKLAYGEPPNNRNTGRVFEVLK